MKHKVAELHGAFLDLAVAKAEGLPAFLGKVPVRTADGAAMVSVCWLGEQGAEAGSFHPSSVWGIGGPILERERITTEYEGEEIRPNERWTAGRDDAFSFDHGWSFAPTLLQAAMRFFVRTKFGEEIDL